jgi:hypothetical protein
VPSVSLCLSLDLTLSHDQHAAWDDDSDKAQLDQDAVNFQDFLSSQFPGVSVEPAVFNLKNGTLTSYAWASEDAPKLISTL